MSTSKSVAIRVSQTLRDTLRVLGLKGESYDDVIIRLIRQLNEAKEDALYWRTRFNATQEVTD